MMMMMTTTMMMMMMMMWKHEEGTLSMVVHFPIQRFYLSFLFLFPILTQRSPHDVIG